MAVAVVYLALARCVTPFLARLFPSYNLAAESGPRLEPQMEFGAVDFTEPSLVWYFRQRTHRFMTPLKRKEAAEFMSRSGPRFLVLPTESVDNVFPDLNTSWQSYHAKGFNVAKGRRVDLTMLLKLN